jgi:DNA-binding NtrC family response regulator
MTNSVEHNWHGMNKLAGIGTAITRNASVLSVSPNDEDCVFLERIFHESDWTLHTNSTWTLTASTTLASSFSVLRERPTPIVLCECDMFPGTWREMLEHISLFPDPPLLIVTSRLADERLWAEALNLGAYDVLAKPFDSTEVIRIVSLAWQHWQDRHELHANRTKQRLQPERKLLRGGEANESNCFVG